ncbi:hypothetical protein pb186bvf_002517 [Paramecium bursaria]
MLVNITNIVVGGKQEKFQSSITFDITFEVLQDMPDEIEWSLVYIGAPKDERYDQVLDSFSMGPLVKGTMQFQLISDPPDYKKIPTKEDLFGITAIILSVSYKSQEFFRVGYYVYNNYTSQENIENEPAEIIIEDISRQILCDKPRITRFDIDWNSKPSNVKEISAKEFMFQEEKQSVQSTEVDDRQQVF